MWSWTRWPGISVLSANCQPCQIVEKVHTVEPCLTWLAEYAPCRGTHYFCLIQLLAHCLISCFGSAWDSVWCMAGTQETILASWAALIMHSCMVRPGMHCASYGLVCSESLNGWFSRMKMGLIMSSWKAVLYLHHPDIQGPAQGLILNV